MTLAARPVLLAAILSLGAAVSLGITRFAYGLLLPIMRDDLDWTYTLAGAMNTANAVGYLLGALTAPMLLRRQGPARLMLWGAVFATLFMAASGFFREPLPMVSRRGTGRRGPLSRAPRPLPSSASRADPSTPSLSRPPRTA